MSSREPFRFETIDVLIGQALEAQTKDARPSPNVWRWIRHRAKAWATRHRLNRSLDLQSVPVRISLDEVLSRRQVYSNHFDAWKRDLWTVSLFDFGELVLRFGW
jgi:hypothetical protein